MRRTDGSAAGWARRGRRGGRPGANRTRPAPALAGLLLAVALVLAGGGGSSLQAQVTWETPRLLGSEVPRGLGLHYVDFGALPGDGRGVLATWTGGLPAGLRLRGGFAEGAGGENAGFGGLDVWTRLTGPSESVPVDVLWTSGVGLGVGEWTLVSVPVGLTVGRSWSGGSVWISPFVHAGVVFDLRVGDGAPEDEFQVGVATDVGVHLALDRGRRVVVSASAGLGDRQAWAVGLVLRP